MNEEENIELAFKLIKCGTNILWNTNYDYDITDCLQGIIDNYDREKEEE